MLNTLTIVKNESNMKCKISDLPEMLICSNSQIPSGVVKCTNLIRILLTINYISSAKHTKCSNLHEN